MWRNYEATTLATPEAFNINPGLVWQFYSYRRHMALHAKPNRAHYALAELARCKENFITLSQNVDGLSQRAKHPQSQLHLLHGSLFNVKCSDFFCKHEETNFSDPIVPALAFPSSVQEQLSATTDHSGRDASEVLSRAMASTTTSDVDISDANVAIPELSVNDLPRCPKCKHGLLRPGVVWFGEMLPQQMLAEIDEWIEAPKKIDLILVIGTSAKVFPAAAYVEVARSKGARVAVINMDRADTPGGRNGMKPGDWFFEGNAGEVVPEILKSVIGDITEE
jgi:NAD-dependent SIR2 family protein deacetylase